MILLWGMSGDDPLTETCDALRQRGAPVVLLDQRDVLETRLELDLDAGGVAWVRGEPTDLGAATAVYIRTYDAYGLPAVAPAGAGSAAWAHVAAVEEALSSWTELTPARVINRLSSMASNGSKPYQSALIQAQGFAVPATLVTTDAAAARAFWERHGTVIYKSVSGVRSVVSRLRPEDHDRLDDVSWCPTQFQQYVPGRDHRVHVVGDAVFPCEVVSDADDYRYAKRQGGSVAMRACALPHDVADRCRATAAALDLPLAGLDLRRTPDGEWYCFEVNPSPCFTYYESHTGLPITDAVAGLLVDGRA